MGEFCESLLPVPHRPTSDAAASDTMCGLVHQRKFFPFRFFFCFFFCEVCLSLVFANAFVFVLVVSPQKVPVAPMILRCIAESPICNCQQGKGELDWSEWNATSGYYSKYE